MRIKLILSDERKPRGYLFLAQIFLLLWLEWISSLFMFHNRDAIEILGVTSKANMQEKTPRWYVKSYYSKYSVVPNYCTVISNHTAVRVHFLEFKILLHKLCNRPPQIFWENWDKRCFVSLVFLGAIFNKVHNLCSIISLQ